MVRIVEAQTVWFVVLQPIAFFIFVLASIAEVNRSPFDIPEAETEVVGGPLTEAAVRSLAWRGRLLVIGFAQGEIPQIPANLLLIKGTSAVGVFWGDFARREPKANGAMLMELFGWLAEGRLRPHVSKTFALQEVPAALRSLLDRQAVGKLVVVP